MGSRVLEAFWGTSHQYNFEEWTLLDSIQRTGSLLNFRMRQGMILQDIKTGMWHLTYHLHTLVLVRGNPESNSFSQKWDT